MEMLVDDMKRHDRGTKYFKYDAQTGNPLTVMYCPNWIKIPDSFKKVNVPKETKSKPGYLHLQGIERNGEGTAFIDWDKLPQPKVLCKVLFGPGNVLGVDFFTGDRSWAEIDADLRSLISFKSALSKIFTLDYLEQSMNIKSDNWSERTPRFYCVAAAGLVLGKGFLDNQVVEQTLTQLHRDSELSQELTAADIDPEHVDADSYPDWLKMVSVAYGEAKDGENTWANLSSMISVLRFTGSKHVSLYWAGDATQSLEVALMDGRFFPILDKSAHLVKVAKWSHHGSKHSNPKLVFDKLNPMRCVVSAGIMHGYTHPRKSNTTWVFGRLLTLSRS